MTSTEKTPKQGISRRTVVQGTAWAVPAVVIATAVPAFAASGGSLTFSGLGCKLPGNATNTFKGYAFEFTASNTTSSTATVKITSVTLDGTDLGASTVINLTGCTALGNPFTVGPDTTLSKLALLTSEAGNSQNGSLVVTFEVSTDGGLSYGLPQTTTATASAPPIIGSCPNTTFTAAEKACIVSF